MVLDQGDLCWNLYWNAEANGCQMTKADPCYSWRLVYIRDIPSVGRQNWTWVRDAKWPSFRIWQRALWLSIFQWHLSWHLSPGLELCNIGNRVSCPSFSSDREPCLTFLARCFHKWSESKSCVRGCVLFLGLCKMARNVCPSHCEWASFEICSCGWLQILDNATYDWSVCHDNRCKLNEKRDQVKIYRFVTIIQQNLTYDTTIAASEVQIEQTKRKKGPN